MAALCRPREDHVSDAFRPPPAATLLNLFCRMFGWLCLVAGLVVFIIGGLGYLRARPYNDGQLASGTVVDNNPVLIENAMNYRPVVNYNVGDRTYTVTALIAESDPLDVGSEVTVSYRPQDPAAGRLITPGVDVMRVAAMVGVVAMAAGLGTLALAARVLPGGSPTTEEPVPGKETDEI